jgi:hypothetical protein
VCDTDHVKGFKSCIPFSPSITVWEIVSHDGATSHVEPRLSSDKVELWSYGEQAEVAGMPLTVFEGNREVNYLKLADNSGFLYDIDANTGEPVAKRWGGGGREGYCICT